MGDQIDFASEKILQTFEDNGFTSGFENIPLPQRVTLPSKGRYPDATFAYIFVKGSNEKPLNPSILKSQVSDHSQVTIKTVF